MIRNSMKKSLLLLLVAALLCMLPIGSRPAYADNHSDYGKLVVSVFVDGLWVEQGSLSYGQSISEKSLQLTDVKADEPTVIRLLQQGGGKSHLDSVVLGTQSPIEVNGDTDEYVRKLAATDQDLINVEASGMVLKFADGNSASMLTIAARVEPEVISTIPFHYPTSNLYKDFDLNSEYYSYEIDSSRGSLVMDGQLNEISSRAPLFQQYTVTGTGHPEGVTYGWVWNDDENLYVVIDFTSDNTFDGDADYTKVYVKTSSGVKEFKVSVPETTWGQPFFTYTDKVSYQHKVYEYQIPLTNLEITAHQTELQLGFAAYGTAAAAAPSATDDDEIHVGVDGRDISVTWDHITNPGHSFDVYILPSTSVLDLNNHTPIVDSIASTSFTTNWTGTSANTIDSAGNLLTGGTYRVYVYTNTGPSTGYLIENVGYLLALKSDVDVSKFSVVDNYTGTEDQLQGFANAVGGADLTVTAYLWSDLDDDGVLDAGELGSAIPLGTSAADGSVSAADIGDRPAGAYTFVITATANGVESTKDAAHAVSVTLTKGDPLIVTLDSISSSNLTAGVAKADDIVTVTFTSNKTLSAFPNVYIGNWATAVTAMSVSGNVYMYSAERTFTDADYEGNVSISFYANTADEGVGVYTETEISGHSVNFDKTAPAGTLRINGGAATTDSATVTLTVTGTDPDGVGGPILSYVDEQQPVLLASKDHLILGEVAASMRKVLAPPLPSVPGSGNVQMSFFNDNGLWSLWEPVGTKAWTLSSGNGTKTVYMKLMDAAGNETAPITASIQLGPSSSYGGGSTSQPVESNTDNVENSVPMEPVEQETDHQHKAYISGYPDGTFRPERSITRAEMAALLVRVSNKTIDNSPDKAVDQASFTYSDVASTHWAKEIIGQATRMGLMKGYVDGSFKAERGMTRAEMAAILSRLLGDAPSSGESFPDVKGHWAQSAIEQVKAGIISGYADGTFRPEQTLTRAEAVTMLNKLLGRGPLTTIAAKWSDVPNGHWAFGQIQEASIDHASEHKTNDK
jgi:hypothetical protein